MDRKPFFEHLAPYLKLIMLVVLILISLIFVSLLGTAIAIPLFGQDAIQNMSKLTDYSDPAVIAQLKYWQIISQVGLFLFPVIAFVLFTARKKSEYLYLKGRPSLLFLAVAMVIMLIGLPLINWLMELNMQLQLPASWSGIDHWMRQTEDDANKLTEAFLVTTSTSSFMVNLLMIAIIPAIGEELLFRGLVMRLFREWTKNVHVAIFISGAIFSFIHFQFLGFLPRFMMGVMFGYMLYWSGSIWVPMLAHFINNATAVIVGFVAATWFPELDFNTFGSSNNPLIIIASTLMVALILYFCWRKRKKEIPSIVVQETITNQDINPNQT
jgi:membrane protease YdiL (CAAX protease family)